MISSQVENMVGAKKHHHRHHKRRQPKHQEHQEEHSFLQQSSKPAARTFVTTKNVAQQQNDAHSQSVDVPIDEEQAINVKMTPTYGRDTVQSVTLKSFRKVVGYDTFNSILKKQRDESKDMSDYYNVTVSMMIKRTPEEGAAVTVQRDADGKTLAQRLDKGFPYDDGDNSIDDQVPLWRQMKRDTSKTNVGQLNGENITKEALKNLVTDRNAPVTAGLVQLSAEGSDGDILSSLLGENVTRGHLKNLVTDRPAPITVSLAQKSDGDILSSLLGENVTRGHLKNLVTDKPAPITVSLSQKSSKTVCGKDSDVDCTLNGENFTKGHLKNIVTDKPAPITVPLNASALAQPKNKDTKEAQNAAQTPKNNKEEKQTNAQAPNDKKAENSKNSAVQAPVSEKADQ
jgi:hypothetical protein